MELVMRVQAEHGPRGLEAGCEKLLKTLNDQLSQLLSRCSYSATKRRSWRRSCDSVYV
jgi:hypothetical protein